MSLTYDQWKAEQEKPENQSKEIAPGVWMRQSSGVSIYDLNREGFQRALRESMDLEDDKIEYFLGVYDQLKALRETQQPPSFFQKLKEGLRDLPKRLIK